MPERPKLDSQTLKRLLSYMRAYKGTLVLVTVCILLSAVAGAASSMFLQKLIDGYIVPMLGTASPDFSGLIRALMTIGCVYLVGTLATWLYNRRMVTIAQGTLKRIRDEMFEKMQRLPIRYFDTHTHGDIMSLYTNDTDTLRLEYERDVKRGLNPQVPAHYFPNDDPTTEPRNVWRSQAQLFYTNWLNYYVYQTTPYDLTSLHHPK